MGDFDRDGRDDILWRKDSGDLAIWMMAGAGFLRDVSVRFVDPSWPIEGLLADRAP